MDCLRCFYDDKVVITFNYKDESSTITFDDLKNMLSSRTGSDLESSGAPEGRNKNDTPVRGCLTQETAPKGKITAAGS